MRERSFGGRFATTLAILAIAVFPFFVLGCELFAPGGDSGTDDDQSGQPIPEKSKADFNGDGSVNDQDYQLLVAAFGLTDEDAGFDARFDLDEDGQITLVDMQRFAALAEEE